MIRRSRMTRATRRIALVVFMILAPFWLPSPIDAAPPSVPITACGQILEGSGFLTGDLDCSGFSDGRAAIVVKKNGHVDLGGFTVTLPIGLDRVGLYCVDKCSVGNGVFATAGRGYAAIQSLNRVKVADVAMHDAPSNGILGRVGTLTNVTVASHLDATCVDGFERLRVVGLSCIDGHSGVRVTKSLKMENSMIVGNGVRGVEATHRLVVRDSVITGADPAHCDKSFVPCADVAVLYPPGPRVSNTTCGTSVRWTPYGFSETWGVCADD
jgi:hypothetical protein